MNKMCGTCLNWKVIGGLALVGLGVWVLAPGLIWAVLPFLLLLICPLSMLFMMWGMQRGLCAVEPAQTIQPTQSELTPDEQLAELKAQLAGLQAQHEAIAREIVELEAARTPVVREAEAVAR
ncbi:MAG: DUF2933 domain-containing protein, partial [Chloroflexi bacterium]|nr:DUF2933 domain-containing protein [Chloroflexota bacterium]